MSDWGWRFSSCGTSRQARCTSHAASMPSFPREENAGDHDDEGDQRPQPKCGAAYVEEKHGGDDAEPSTDDDDAMAPKIRAARDEPDRERAEDDPQPVRVFVPVHSVFDDEENDDDDDRHQDLPVRAEHADGAGQVFHAPAFFGAGYKTPGNRYEGQRCTA